MSKHFCFHTVMHCFKKTNTRNVTIFVLLLASFLHQDIPEFQKCLEAIFSIITQYLSLYLHELLKLKDL